MPEETQDNKENQSEKEDNRLPYEKPKLRKHGQVNDTTLSIPIIGPRFDRIFGSPRAFS
ncbi:DEAD/DEAH box helicase [Plectonema cf. radiosum LEGE 06105]|uniref:DEAD/DEAH box helicase n=1 Tax=Plectonema cf. radiosum LEGE 06105 TaxID=945769 RepID=A0A8J7JZ32_9CYAN|nr:DEAD/DEAH box helicase [Plectonema radiosum]MBE9212032.1 DEAD/DEAH box helicase [Plectonema cf. radiosum LEGE 06105]